MHRGHTHSVRLSRGCAVACSDGASNQGARDRSSGRRPRSRRRRGRARRADRPGRRRSTGSRTHPARTRAVLGIRPGRCRRRTRASRRPRARGPGSGHRSGRSTERRLGSDGRRWRIRRSRPWAGWVSSPRRAPTRGRWRSSRTASEPATDREAGPPKLEPETSAGALRGPPDGKQVREAPRDTREHHRTAGRERDEAHSGQERRALVYARDARPLGSRRSAVDDRDVRDPDAVQERACETDRRAAARKDPGRGVARLALRVRSPRADLPPGLLRARRRACEAREQHREPADPEPSRHDGARPHGGQSVACTAQRASATSRPIRMGAAQPRSRRCWASVPCGLPSSSVASRARAR